MSPRSEELLTSAREHVAAARSAHGAGFGAVGVSAAYYAMRYAARAALSKEDRNARTHRGTWTLFQEAFVDTGRFDAELLAAARRAQERREAADYDAWLAPLEQAGAIVADAERFVLAVAQLLGA